MPERNVGQLPLYPSSKTSADWGEVDAAVRNNAFFSACIEDERLLSALQKLVAQATDEGWSVGTFVDEALQMLDNIALDPETRGDETFQDNFNRLYDVERLRLIYLTQKQLSAGYRNFAEAFEPFQLQMYPAWEFRRQPGAREQYKREDHVKHEGEVRLKTDLKFWLLRNREDIGGFGNPFGPWGFNSWMREISVPREKVEQMGLLKPGERLTIPPEYAKWGIGKTLQDIGSAGVSDLTDEQKQTVVDRCKDEGVTVTQPDDNHLQVTPDKDNESDPLVKIELAELEDWATQEVNNMMEEARKQLDQLSNLSDEDFMSILFAK